MTIPPKGFYIHYKHDPLGEPYNYMYEVVGMGRNTEDKIFTVLYRPLYKNDWMAPVDLQSRPLDMFLENIEKDGEQVPRFIMVTDEKLIGELEQMRKEMYGE